MTSYTMPAIRRASLVFGAVSLAGTLGACSSTDSSTASNKSDTSDTSSTTASRQATAAFVGLGDDETITTSEYVGAIEGTDIYAAFAITRSNDTGEIVGGTAYFCDGTKVANWFSPSTTDGETTFTAADGNSFVPRVSDETITAEVTLGGISYTVTATEVDADGDAGLYLSDHVIDADLHDNERGGWIVLSDGTQRGAIRGGSVLLPSTGLVSGATTVAADGRDILLRAITHIIALPNS